MTRAYSDDLRQRVVASVATGRSRRETGGLFDVSASTVTKWWQRFQASGSVTARKSGAAGKLVLLPARDWMLARISTAPDLTVRALQAELVARGTPASYGAVWSFLAREGLTFKKSLRAGEQSRPDVARRRSLWRKYQGRIAPSRLVFVDETWTKTNMTRTHGRAPPGRRLVARVPHGRWKTMTFLAALRRDRIDPPCVIDGPINGTIFRAWVEQFLIPTLRPGDVVVLDNLGSHKGSAVRRAIRAAGAHRCSCRPTAPTSIRSR